MEHFYVTKASVDVPKTNWTEKPKLERKAHDEIKLKLVTIYNSVKNQYLKLLRKVHD